MPRLHHVNIVVPLGDADRVADFYVEILGLTRVPKPKEGAGSGGAWLAVDEASQVHIAERANATTHPDQHFALVLEDFAAVLERVRASGAPWVEQAAVFGGGRGWTRDPVGNRIELLEAKGDLA